jgi:hydrogenase expression/formation protein HypC
MCLAIPGRVLSIDADDAALRTARVQFGGIVKSVSLAMTPEARVDDYVLIHAGLAIGIVDAEEAAQTLAYFQEIGAMEGELDAP